MTDKTKGKLTGRDTQRKTESENRAMVGHSCFSALDHIFYLIFDLMLFSCFFFFFFCFLFFSSVLLLAGVHALQAGELRPRDLSEWNCKGGRVVGRGARPCDRVVLETGYLDPEAVCQLHYSRGPSVLSSKKPERKPQSVCVCVCVCRCVHALQCICVYVG